MADDIQVFVECGANLDSKKFPFTRKHFYLYGQTDEFRFKHNNTGVYETVMRYVSPQWEQDEKGRWVINTRECLKYGDFYLDFDNVLHNDTDFETVKQDVRSALRYLKVILSIQPDQVQLFYSGNKGIHLIVDASVFGVKPHIALNAVYKEIATDIANYCKNKTIDTKVYDDKRMFRMVNSLNKKGQRFKIPITMQEFERCTLEEIRLLATQPRFIPVKPAYLNMKAKQAMDKIMDKWTERIRSYKERGERRFVKLDKIPECIEIILNKTFRETVDERNNTATALTSFFFQQEMDKEETLDRMIAWGENNCIPPLPKREIETIVRSVYSGKYRYGCETFRKLACIEGHECCLYRKITKGEMQTCSRA